MEKESYKQHIEMECVHNHVSNTMACVWLEGRIKLVVFWANKVAAIVIDGEVKDSFSVDGMSIDEFVRKQEHCQVAAEQMQQFDAPVCAHV